MSRKVFVGVLDANGVPLMPCSGKSARRLLERGRARVVHHEPFVVQLNDRYVSDCKLQDIEVKVDPGSKFTGLCVGRITSTRALSVIRLIELAHRGHQISRNLLRRAAFRRARRQRNTRYRAPRFLNRTKPKGWLAPSLMHRVHTTISWIKRLIRWYPVTSLAVERVKFDLQKLENDAISGKEYQRGELFEREVMEYLLERDGRKCVYCDTDKAMFEKDHVRPRSQGGSNRVSNLVLSCRPCNQAKGALSVESFLFREPDRLKKVLARLKKPLRDAAAVNATRNRLFTEMLRLGLPVMTGTGAQTKWNRSRLGVPKTHALDAACVGEVNGVLNWKRPHLEVRCTGRGTYARTRTDKYGFPRLFASRVKRHYGFQTGDLVSACRQRDGIKTTGRVTVRANGGFVVETLTGFKSFTWRQCTINQLADGYSYLLRSYCYIDRNAFPVRSFEH